jgi:hypothetical protein
MAVSLSEIGIGAILRRLLSRPSSVTSGTGRSPRFLGLVDMSRSDSLLSLSLRPALPMVGMPVTELLALWLPPCPCAGVRGGVHIGTGPEFAAARLGTDDIAGVGAFREFGSPALGAKDAMLDTELLRVGLPDLAGTNELGEAGNPADGCLCIGCAVALVVAGAVAVAVPDMLPDVGVAVGVD